MLPTSRIALVCVAAILIACSAPTVADPLGALRQAWQDAVVRETKAKQADAAELTKVSECSPRHPSIRCPVGLLPLPPSRCNRGTGSVRRHCRPAAWRETGGRLLLILPHQCPHVGTVSAYLYGMFGQLNALKQTQATLAKAYQVRRWCMHQVLWR